VVDLLVIRDNVTRWNSTYVSIHRALKLKPRIVAFTLENIKDIEQDILSDDDWEELKHIKRILAPF
jgi:hypothetical protein